MIDKMTPQAVIDRLETLYNQSVANLRDAVKVFLETGERADIEARANGLFSYPKLTISWFGDKPQNLETRAFGRLSRPGIYTTTITRPDLFRNYLLEQLTLLADEYDATFEVGPSDQEIPFPYVLDGSGVVLDSTMTACLIRTRISRCRNSTACAPTSRWHAFATIPARRSRRCRAISCSPTITAMSTSSCVGQRPS